jgi:uncharacterized protein
VIADEPMRLALARAAQAVPTGTASLPSAGPQYLAAAQYGGAPETIVADVTQDESDLCRSCGACCSYSAEWPRFSLESDDHLDRIPRELVGEGERGMRCTGARCSALVGVVGRSTSCGIYEMRPDVCRACLPGDDACRQARRHFGL